jgi:hypothetical protein
VFLLAQEVSKSWFCVFNHPEEHGYSGTPQEICDKLVSVWIENSPQRTCAVIYCVSSEGLPHCHAVFEDVKAMRFSAVKKLYPGMHIEPTKGDKKQAEDYINKRGVWEEKGEKIICSSLHGEIKGFQGQRRDLDVLEELLQQGRTPKEILSLSLSYRRYEKIIRDAYYQMKYDSLPVHREIKVFWHIGDSGSGKTYTVLDLIEKHGDENVFMLSDYKNGFDKYDGESVLFMDEFRGQMPFSTLLLYLGGYRVQLPCRYSNTYALWSEVHITSVLPPESCYSNMVEQYKQFDTFQQLRRRVDYVVYHYCEDSGQSERREFKQYVIPMTEYTDSRSFMEQFHQQRRPKQIAFEDTKDLEGLPF